MKGYTSEDFIALFEAIAGRIEREKDHLCALDGLIGDADHGIAMAQGFNAASAAVSALDPASKMPADIFNAAASAFLNAVGASSGPLYATAMMRAGAALKGKQTASDEDVAAALQAMAKGIEDRGKAVVGEKTMVDAWRTRRMRRKKVLPRRPTWWQARAVLRVWESGPVAMSILARHRRRSSFA